MPTIYKTKVTAVQNMSNYKQYFTVSKHSIMKNSLTSLLIIIIII